MKFFGKIFCISSLFIKTFFFVLVFDFVSSKSVYFYQIFLLQTLYLRLINNDFREFLYTLIGMYIR